jgi:hypothetical protein
MIRIVNKTSFSDFVKDEEQLRQQMEDTIIESDFNADEVELRFADQRVMTMAIRIFNDVAYKMKYRIQIVRETEIYVFGLDNNKTRFVFMNSIPENCDGTESE